MTFAFIASADIGGATGGTTAAINTTGATLIVIGVSYGDSDLPIVSDSQSNTWTALTEFSPSGVGCRIYYCINPTTNASHTFTLDADIGSFSVAAFSGTSPTFDIELNGVNGDVNYGIIGNATFTPTNANSLVINALQFGGVDVTVPTNASGWTNVGFYAGVGGTNYGNCLNYQIQTTITGIASTTHTVDFNATQDQVVSSASFYEGSAAGTIRKFRSLTNVGY